MFLVSRTGNIFYKQISQFCFLEKDFLFCAEFTSGYEGYRMVLTSFADMEAVRLFLRARAVIKCALQAASTLENTERK